MEAVRHSDLLAFSIPKIKEEFSLTLVCQKMSGLIFVS